MHGTLERRRGRYRWKRIGFASAKLRSGIRICLALAVVITAALLYSELPKVQARWVVFLGIYLAAGLLYLNLGVWLHEQLHCLVFRRTALAKAAQIKYLRKHIFILGGYYRVRGAMTYRLAAGALLGPARLSGALLVAACLTAIFRPGWWTPLLASMLLCSLIDMTDDLYFYWNIRAIGNKAKYWDRGAVIEAVWEA